ncbi:MAG: hypothetical protein EZS28_020944 [Streblomastix strix]|uniref:Uncharacterized protein n=1 Tax=Streblomastix strix TaxID=222440 RepID=A0A5J4VLQ2_9EUKA|nr:MAG: hypothetical protein EZS28_020944 [Streblomastix strix]
MLWGYLYFRTKPNKLLRRSVDFSLNALAKLLGYRENVMYRQGLQNTATFCEICAIVCIQKNDICISSMPVLNCVVLCYDIYSLANNCHATSCNCRKLS